MESETIIAQLTDREAIVLNGLFWCVPVMKQAAVHIKALEREIARLNAEANSRQIDESQKD
jgi:hypothetical protein